MLRKGVVGAFLAAAGMTGLMLSSQPAAAAVTVWDLFDHPAGGASDPTYGLRMDGMEQYMTQGMANEPDFGTDRTWTFSFDCATCGVQGILDDQGTASLADDTFRILGTVRGGIDIGSAYANNGVMLSLDFIYAPDGNGNGRVGPDETNGAP